MKYVLFLLIGLILKVVLRNWIIYLKKIIFMVEIIIKWLDKILGLKILIICYC